MHKVYLMVPLHTGVVCSSIVFFLCMYCLSPSCFTHIKKKGIFGYNPIKFSHTVGGLGQHCWLLQPVWYIAQVPGRILPLYTTTVCSALHGCGGIFWPLRQSQVWAHHLKSSCLLTLVFVSSPQQTLVKHTC